MEDGESRSFYGWTKIRRRGKKRPKKHSKLFDWIAPSFFSLYFVRRFRELKGAKWQ